MRSDSTSPVPATTATAPGKIILAGEHAVVYGRPAIAVPIREREATATVSDAPAGAGCRIIAPQIELEAQLADLPDDNPLALIVRLALAEAQRTDEPDLRIEVAATIPIAGGLGSGAAICTALARALLAHFYQPAPPELVSGMVYESERIHHGTPSGIDNTVIAYEMPVWFVKGSAPKRFRVAAPVTLVIGDSGRSAHTRAAVGDVRRRRDLEPARFDSLFDAIGQVVLEIRRVLEEGKIGELGPLLDENQRLLVELGVSSPELDRLIGGARNAGALGAKLSGAGWGGNMLALTTPDRAKEVAAALLTAGAASVLVTTVAP